MQKFIVFLSFVALAIAAEPEKKFKDFDIYKIESKLVPDGVLSVNTGSAVNSQNLTDIPEIAVWKDSAGQKWRLDSSALFTAFQLRPTMYESFVLEQSETDTFLKWVASITRFGQHKLWYLNDAGNGFTQIKNKHYDSCLTASGLKLQIGTDVCTNSDEQQWRFVKL